MSVQWVAADPTVKPVAVPTAELEQVDVVTVDGDGRRHVDGCLSSIQVVALAGCSYRQLDYWTRQGILQPIGGHGSGSRRRWPADEQLVAVVCAAVARALDAGFDQAILLKHVARQVRMSPDRFRDAGGIRIDGPETFDPRITPIDAAASYALIVPLGGDR